MTDNATESGGEEMDELAPLPDDATFSAHAIHMIRTATTANLMLSQMADQKASILMGAQFVVLTIAIGQANNSHYPLSLLCLALAAFVSAMFSIGAVVPNVKAKPPPGLKPNVLFFGVFAEIDEEDFIERMLRNSTEDRRVFATMLRDIHQNGLVLQRRKYKYLKYAYRVFQAGLTLTVMIFVYESRGDFAGLFS